MPAECEGLEAKTKFFRLPNNNSIEELKDRLSETCRSAKAENLLLKDLTTVPTQGLYSNQ